MEIDIRATSELRELFAKKKDTLVDVFNFNEQKFNEICDNLDSLKKCQLCNQFIQNISLAIGDLVRDYDNKKGYIDIRDNVCLEKLHTLLNDTESKLSKLLKLNQIISILEKHNISKINIILSDVMFQDLTNSYLSSLSALWEKINLIERFIKNYPTNDSSYTCSIELLLLIKKFDYVDYDTLKDNARLRNALALIFQCYEQLEVKFNPALFLQLKENQEAIKSLDKLYSLMGANDALPVKEVNDILSDLSKNSSADSARKTPTSPQETPNASPSGNDANIIISPTRSSQDEIRASESASQVALSANDNDDNNFSSGNSTSHRLYKTSILERAEKSVLSSCKDNKLGARSSKITLAAGLGLMAAGAVLAVFSAFALAGTGGLSSVLSAAGLFASYKMIMTGILLAVGTETFFLGEKAMLNNCASFFGKKSAPAAAAAAADDALMMSDNLPPSKLFRVLT